MQHAAADAMGVWLKHIKLGLGDGACCKWEGINSAGNCLVPVALKQHSPLSVNGCCWGKRQPVMQGFVNSGWDWQTLFDGAREYVLRCSCTFHDAPEWNLPEIFAVVLVLSCGPLVGILLVDPGIG